MSDASVGVPKWLLDSKDYISRSPEWIQFIEALYEAIEQQLKQNHVEAFSDLTDAERKLFMDRAVALMQPGQPFKALYSKASIALDQHLNNEVARQLLEEFPINTKSDLILDCAQDGAVAMLKKWPDMKSKLRISFNQALPTRLRQLAWKLFLDNTPVRKVYVDLLNSNPRHAISPLDLEISQRCERLIVAEPTFKDIKGSVGAFYAMKATLSYHHALKRTRDSLIDIDYMLVVPFVIAVHERIPRRDPAPNTIVANLVEQYLTFMTSRPGFVVDSGSEDHNKEYTAYINAVYKHLQERGMRTAKALANKFSPQKDKIIATDAGRLAVLMDGLPSLLRPIIRSLFVGYVNMDVTLFIWDQYMMGIDAEGFHEHFLPMVTAIFLMLLHTTIDKCPEEQQLGTVLKQEGIKLKVSQFQYEMNKLFFKDLFAMLNQDNRSAVPVLDPTQSYHAPWMHWFKDVIPSRTTPQDRRQARDMREEERAQLLRRQEDRERQQYLRQLDNKKQDEAELLRARDEERHHYDQQRHNLEEALENERRERLQAERGAEAEIERLRREVEALKNARPNQQPYPAYSRLSSRISRYLIPPPPTAATHAASPIQPMLLDSPTPPPRRAPPKRPTPADEPGDDPILAFLERVAEGFHTVANGDPRQKQNLDEMTKNDVKNHRQDVIYAEKKVFGRELKPGEFQKLTSDEQDVKSDEMMEVIKRRIQERHRRQQQGPGK